MFTCIEALPENEGLFAKLYEKIKPPLPEREFVQVKGGTPFLRLKVRENHIDLRKILSLLQGEERRILASFPVEEAMPCALGLNIILEEFLYSARETGNADKISVSVFDEKGYLTEKIKKLVPVVRNISVYTEKIEEYFRVSSEIMEEWGLSVKINAYISPAPPEKIIIGDRYCKNMRNAEVVFLGEGSVVSYNTVTGSAFNMPEEYKILKGNNIDDFLFASFLYEYNRVTCLDECRFETLLFAGKEINRNTLCERMK